jgi:WD40 repeat protein
VASRRHAPTSANTHRSLLLLLLQANVLYSGADDSTFKGWDIRCPTAVATTTTSTLPPQQQQQQQQQQDEAAERDDDGDSAVPLFANRRAHGAGVCCISSHPRREHVLVTGSYDEAVRLWDTRMINKPVESCQVRAILNVCGWSRGCNWHHGWAVRLWDTWGKGGGGLQAKTVWLGHPEVSGLAPLRPAYMWNLWRVFLHTGFTTSVDSGQVCVPADNVCLLCRCLRVVGVWRLKCHPLHPNVFATPLIIQR